MITSSGVALHILVILDTAGLKWPLCFISMGVHSNFQHTPEFALLFFGNKFEVSGCIITPIYTLVYYSSFHFLFHYPYITPIYYSSFLLEGYWKYVKNWSAPGGRYQGRPFLVNCTLLYL